MSNVYLCLYVFLWHNNKLYSISSSKVPFINTQEKAYLLLPYGSGLHILIHHPHTDNKYSCNININKMYWRHFFHPYLIYCHFIVYETNVRLCSVIKFQDKWFFNFSMKGHIGKRIIITSIYFWIYKTMIEKSTCLYFHFPSNSFGFYWGVGNVMAMNSPKFQAY